MLCPSCNHDGAYVGLMTVECASENCAHFSISAPGYKPKIHSIPEKPKLDLFKRSSEPAFSFGRDANCGFFYDTMGYRFKIEIDGIERSGFRANKEGIDKVWDDLKKHVANQKKDYSFVYAPVQVKPLRDASDVIIGLSKKVEMQEVHFCIAKNRNGKNGI